LGRFGENVSRAAGDLHRRDENLKRQGNEVSHWPTFHYTSSGCETKIQATIILLLLDRGGHELSGNSTF